MQFKYQKLLLERCFIVNLDVLKSFNILELTYKRICSILKIIIIKDCIMTAVHSRLSLWMPKFIECRYDLKQFPYEKLLIQANQMHLSFKNICFNHIWYHAWSQKMGEIVRFLWYFMVFWRRTYGELMIGLGEILVKRIFILCARVISRWLWFGFFEFLKKNGWKWWNCSIFMVFYGISKKDLWGTYGWTWDIVDFFVKSIHYPL